MVGVKGTAERYSRGGREVAMAMPQKEPLRPVLPEEQRGLEQLAKASSERVDRVRRATALVGVAQGASFAQAARQAGLQSGSCVAARVPPAERQRLGVDEGGGVPGAAAPPRAGPPAP